jgi:hypothetical protein
MTSYLHTGVTFLTSDVARMYPGTFEMTMSLLLSDVDAGCCFSSQTKMNDVSRQVSNSVNGGSGELSVSITQLALTFYLYEMASRVFFCFDSISAHCCSCFDQALSLECTPVHLR